MGVEKVRPAAGRPTTYQRRALSDRILLVAKKQFLERGYNGTTFGSIAEEVPTSRGALYNRFPDKAALFSQVVKTDIEEMCARTILLEYEGPIEESLTRRATQIVSVSMEPQHTALYRIIIKDAPRTRVIDDALKQAWAFFVAHIQDYLASPAAGASIAIASPEKSAVMFMGLVFQPVHTAIVYGYPMPTPQELSTHIAAAVSMFLGGVSRL